MLIYLIIYLVTQIIVRKYIISGFIFLDDTSQEGDRCQFNQTVNGICSYRCPVTQYDPKLCSISDNNVLYCCEDTNIFKQSNFRRLREQLEKPYIFKVMLEDNYDADRAIPFVEDFNECLYNNTIIGVCRVQCPALKFPKYKLLLTEKQFCPNKYGVPFECCVNHLQIAYEPASFACIVEAFQLGRVYEEGDFCPYDNKHVGICENICIENNIDENRNKFNRRNAICNHQVDGTPIYCCNDYFSTSGIADEVFPFARNGDECRHQVSKRGTCKYECKKVQRLERFGIIANMCPHEIGKRPLYCCPNLNEMDEYEKYWRISSGRRFFKKCQEYEERKVKRFKRRIHSHGSSYAEFIFLKGGGVLQMSYVVRPSGGIAIRYGQFPYMASIGWTNPDGTIERKCGGILISDDFVLTAAHCTLFNNVPPDAIRIGDQYFDKIEDPNNLPQDFKISNIIKHPKYKHSSNYNDIALIKLNQSITPTSIVQPACLWNDNDDIDDELSSTAMGYGSTEFGGPNARELLFIKLQRLDHEECVKAYKDFPIKSRLKYGILDTQICAIDPGGNQDTCQGDSGGPLEYNINNVDYVYGITSFGLNCPSSVPSVYTKISKYLDWIESIVWPIIE